jgi:phosphoribosyl 1,2-cyclic phosphate phosphodiesterase
MKVTLLGVGGSAGMPQIGGADGRGDWGELDPAEPRNRRTRPSIVIHGPDDQRILVDTGPDLRLQLTAQAIGRVDAVIYTHAHADHIAGLDEIRILNRILGAPMPSYATAGVWAELRQRFDYAFAPYNGGYFIRPVLTAHEMKPGETVEIAGMAVRGFVQDHGYVDTLGLRVGDFAYCTDVVRLNDAALAALKGVRTLVVDCFTLGPAHPTHAHLEQVLDWVARLSPARTVLTHMGPNMDYRRLVESLPPGIEPGYDGQVLAVDLSVPA